MNSSIAAKNSRSRLRRLRQSSDLLSSHKNISVPPMVNATVEGVPLMKLSQSPQVRESFKAPGMPSAEEIAPITGNHLLPKNLNIPE